MIYVLMPVKITEIVKEENNNDPDEYHRGIKTVLNNQIAFIYQKDIDGANGNLPARIQNAANEDPIAPPAANPIGGYRRRHRRKGTKRTRRHRS